MPLIIAPEEKELEVIKILADDKIKKTFRIAWNYHSF